MTVGAGVPTHCLWTVFMLCVGTPAPTLLA